MGTENALGFEPAVVQKASEEIVSQIQNSILSGKLKPGDALPPERELIRMFARSRPTVREALRGDYKNDCRVRMPEHFEAELNYKNHFTAYKYSFYPGAVLEGGRTVRFRSNDYGEILRFFHFCL